MSDNSRSKPSRGNAVDEEVRRLLKKSKGNLSQNDFNRLRNKYDNEQLVEQIQQAFLETHDKIMRRAKKFANLIREKYADSSYPFHILLEKAMQHKKKLGLNDEEFAHFKRIYEAELSGTGVNDVILPTTNMMKVLGTVDINMHEGRINIDDSDQKYMQEIMRSFSSNRSLHAQVLLQSLKYTDCSYEALTGKFNREQGHNAGDHIHPVIAALFLPKIDCLEDHFLRSNIAGLVKSRYKREALANRADYQLLYALTTDPNDVVCSTSPVHDLMNRCNVQAQLWNSVVNLRNGQYYNASFREFVAALDTCKLNKYDNPDLIYGRHDGVVLKRLFSVFSFRPTIVATTPVFTGQTFSTNPYMQSVRPSVSSVPMVNMRLPVSLNNEIVVELKDALSQSQLFIEGDHAVPKQTDLIYSQGVLVFFIDRRAHMMSISNLRPFNLLSLPNAMSGYEKINDRRVNFDSSINIRNDIYNLRSVVLSEVMRDPENPHYNIVTGSSAAIVVHPDPERGIVSHQFLHYDPYGVTGGKPMAGEHGVKFNDPITILHSSITDDEMDSFTDMAQQRGTVFIYQNVSGEPISKIHY